MNEGWDPTISKKVKALQEEVAQLAALLEKVITLGTKPIPHHVGAHREGKVIYIVGPYTGTPQDIAFNVITARDAAKQLVERGHTPIVPHTNFDAFGLDEWKTVMHCCLDIIHRVDAIVLLPGWRFSLGSRCERYAAYATGRTVYNSLDDVPDLRPKPDPEVLEELSDIVDYERFQQASLKHSQNF